MGIIRADSLISERSVQQCLELFVRGLGIFLYQAYQKWTLIGSGAPARSAKLWGVLGLN